MNGIRISLLRTNVKRQSRRSFHVAAPTILKDLPKHSRNDHISRWQTRSATEYDFGCAGLVVRGAFEYVQKAL